MLIPEAIDDAIPDSRQQSESFVLVETIQNLMQSGFVQATKESVKVIDFGVCDG